MISVQIQNTTTESDLGNFDMPVIPNNGSIICFDNKTLEVISSQYNMVRTKVGAIDKVILKQVIISVKEINQ